MIDLHDLMDNSYDVFITPLDEDCPHIFEINLVDKSGEHEVWANCTKMNLEQLEINVARFNCILKSFLAKMDK